jgi:hypothetical protein
LTGIAERVPGTRLCVPTARKRIETWQRNPAAATGEIAAAVIVSPIWELPMPDLQWLDGYSGESVDELIVLEGKYRRGSLVLAFEQAMAQKAARAGEDSLTADERTILAVEALEREVNNGGYGQFFLNSREYASIIVDALGRRR